MNQRHIQLWRLLWYALNAIDINSELLLMFKWFCVIIGQKFLE